MSSEFERELRYKDWLHSEGNNLNRKRKSSIKKGGDPSEEFSIPSKKMKHNKKGNPIKKMKFNKDDDE